MIAVPDPQLPEMNLPEITVDLSTVVDILTDYNVKHIDLQFFSTRFYGVTDPNSKTIILADSYDLGDRRDTVLHEMVHAAYRRFGIDTSGPAFEILVEAKAQKLLKELFPPK